MKTYHLNDYCGMNLEDGIRMRSGQDITFNNYGRTFVVESDELIDARTGKETGLRYNAITGFVEPQEA